MRRPGHTGVHCSARWRGAWCSSSEACGRCRSNALTAAGAPPARDRDAPREVPRRPSSPPPRPSMRGPRRGASDGRRRPAGAPLGRGTSPSRARCVCHCGGVKLKSAVGDSGLRSLSLLVDFAKFVAVHCVTRGGRADPPEMMRRAVGPLPKRRSAANLYLSITFFLRLADLPHCGTHRKTLPPHTAAACSENWVCGSGPKTACGKPCGEPTGK